MPSQQTAHQQEDGESVRPGSTPPEEKRRDLKYEDREIHEKSAAGAHIVYKAILKEGQEELGRPTSALWWSGLAAGLSMGFSPLAESLLRSHLPNAPWQALISKLGYSMGFLIVVLGRQQLFTENTLTPILPFLKQRTFPVLRNVLRLWGIVLLANWIGAIIFAIAAAHTSALSEEVKHTFLQLGQAADGHTISTLIIRGIYAGWLIALMVWLLPVAEVGRIWVIILITYLVALGEMSHVIVGTVEVGFVASMGQITWLHCFVGYMLPTLLGNVLGGVSLVAALNHAQVTSGETE